MNLKNLSKYRYMIFGIAILIVMTFHYTEDALKVVQPGNVWYPLLRWYWNIFCGDGTDMFAFLSGMGLYFSLQKNPDLKACYGRRLKRVVIPYCIIAGVFWFVRDILVKHKSWRRMAKDFFFVTFVNGKTTTFWYIFFAIAVYMIFPLLYYLFTRKGVWRWLHFIWTMAFSLGICILVCIRYPEFFSHVYLALARAHVFVLGCFMGKPIKEEKKMPTWLIFILFAVTLGIRLYVVGHSLPGYWWMFSLSWFGLALMFMLAWITSKLPYQRPVRVFEKIGIYSMELYMIHIAVRNLLTAFGYPTPALWPWKFMLSVAFVFILSVASHHLIGRLMDWTAVKFS